MFPNKTEARTITPKFVIAGGDKNEDSFRPDAQVQVFYAQIWYKLILQPIKLSIAAIGIGSKMKGTQQNPGFHVISGSM